MLQPADVLVDLVNDRPRYIILISYPAACERSIRRWRFHLTLSFTFRSYQNSLGSVRLCSPSLLWVLKALIDLSRDRL